MTFIKLIEYFNTLMSFFRGSKDFFIICSQDGKINSCATFWRLFFTVTPFALFLICWLKIQEISVAFHNNEKEDAVFDEMDRMLKQCGMNSYMFWILFNSDQQLRIKTAHGCVNDTEDCIQTNIKDQNPKLKGNKPIDLNTANLINNTESNSISIVMDNKMDDNTKFLFNRSKEGSIVTIYGINEIRKYDTLYKMVVEEPNLQLDVIGITIIKNKLGKPIHAFSFSFANKAQWKCRYPWTMLQQFGFNIKENL